MKNVMMKLTYLSAYLVLSLGGALSCAKDNSSEPAFAKGQNSATLISRYTDGDYTTATYSFRHGTRDNVELTRNNWELLFEGREDFEKDFFEVNMVVDDNSLIFDLGKRSCADISSKYPEDRKENPMSWLTFSEIALSELEPADSAEVHVGHCYLTFNNDEDSRVIALFRVKSHKKSVSVTIDQIEVLNVLTGE